MDAPRIPLEDFEIPDVTQSELGIKNDYQGSVEYGIIGSGQCGGRIAKSFYNLGYKKVVALNTSTSDLKPLELPEKQKLRIGNLEGSGKDMIKGKVATADSYQVILDKVKSVFGTVDKIVICVGFGGGTGAGGLSTLIEIAQKYMEQLKSANPVKDVIILAALPTDGELKSTIIGENAKKVEDYILRLVKDEKIGPLFFIDNSKIESMYRGIAPAEFWSIINDSITGLFHTFNHLSKQPSEFSTFDAEAYKAVLGGSGCAVMGVTKIKPGEELSQALQANLKKTLLFEGVDYKTAKNAACVITADSESLKNVSMDKINYGFDAIHNLLGSATIHRGLFTSKQKGFRAYTMITGMKEKDADTSAYK